MSGSKEFICPMNHNCNRLQSDGNCDWGCMVEVVKRAQVVDLRDGYYGSADIVSQLGKEKNDSKVLFIEDSRI